MEGLNQLLSGAPVRSAMNNGVLGSQGCAEIPGTWHSMSTRKFPINNGFNIGLIPNTMDYTFSQHNLTGNAIFSDRNLNGNLTSRPCVNLHKIRLIIHFE
jgi:hypothetical protein